MKIVKDSTALKTITIEQLKGFDGFADLSNQEAEHIIATLKQLSIVTLNMNTEYEQSSTFPKLRETEQ